MWVLIEKLKYGLNSEPVQAQANKLIDALRVVAANLEIPRNPIV
jgi:hypothetical protein